MSKKKNSDTRKWYKIDNAAKIVPSTARGADTRVFRIVCELNEEVDGSLLQIALDRAAADYPLFNSFLRRGLFWYYLDGTNERVMVQEENKPACSPLFYEGRRRHLYRVVYYKNRINLEMFHVLTDGTGAFEFLKCIVTEYLRLRYDLKAATASVNRTTISGKEDDAFQKFYEKMDSSSEDGMSAPRKAYHLQGDMDEDLTEHLLEGTVSAKEIVAASKKHGATVTEFIIALLLESILSEMSVREKRFPVVLSIPVNLRNYFPSGTAKNFFNVINVTFDPMVYDGTLDSIITEVHESFKIQLDEERIRYTMNKYAQLEHNLVLRLVPLTLKNLVISRVNAKVQKGITGTVSNLGVITVPDEIRPYINKFSCFMAAPEMQVCVCSFGDKLVFGIASAFIAHPVFARFFRKLAGMGLEVEVTSNDFDIDPEDEPPAKPKPDTEN